MSNILDYIRWRGDLTFAQDELNEVDSLILSELSYLNFQGIAQTAEGVPLKEAAARYFEEGRDKQKNTGDLLRPEYFSMLAQLAESRRFSDIILSSYVQKLEPEENLQFSAVTCRLRPGVCYAAYRGTDDTLLGWKEDFLMSALDTVPSQEEALRYFRQAMEENTGCRWYLGGHSKGGNLAVYTAVNAGQRAQRRLKGVFNHDGPGFREQVLKSAAWQAVQDRIRTTVPQASIVGMLLEHGENYTVVRSAEKGAMQHDGLSWEVCGPQFVHLGEVTRESRLADMTIRRVLGSLNDEQRRQFTEALFEVLEANQNRTLTDIRTDGFRAVRAMIRTYDNLGYEAKRALQSVAVKLLTEGFHSIQREHANRRSKPKEGATDAAE
ncbi:MAG: DUF2974 domain-containing protein [Lachnospiraceae bacterium]|nr:DUF2974 domain-containing protein [Lachnospiraceae bacterium]